MMKKIVLTLLIVSMLYTMCACAVRNPGSSAPAGSSANSPAPDSGETGEPPQAVGTDRFYEARGVSGYDEAAFGSFTWNRDGTFWVQDLNTINVIGPDNGLIKAVSLDETKLPSSYNLTWGGSRILAIRNNMQNGEYSYEYGAVYQADGKISLCGVSVWDMDGNLIKDYPAFPLGAEDAESWTPTAPDGAKLDWWNALYDGITVYWLDDHTIAINGHNRIVIYDLDSDTGRMVDDMSAIVEKYGKFGVYYGVDYNSCYTDNGNFYYLAHRDEEKSNTVGTIWKVGKDERQASVMFEGKEFTHLYMDGSTMVLTESLADASGYKLWWADAVQGVLNEMGDYAVHVPIVLDEGRASMSGDAAQLYCYDTKQLKENALTVVDTGDAYGLHGTRLTAGGDLQFVYSAFDENDETPISFYLYDAKTGERKLIAAYYLYSQLLLSPDKNSCVVYGAGEQGDMPRVRVVKLDQ